MAQKTNMRVIGVVENMTSEVFGSGGGAQLAGAVGVPLLGTVPLDPALREAGDRGEPLVWTDSGAEAAQAILAVAEAIDAARQTFKPLPVLS
jgi:ATP-binding protein involved in chromosome partitioning